MRKILSADLVKSETNCTEKDTTFSHKQERNFGSVERTIRIPDDALEETAYTKCNNGFLEVVFLKKEGALVNHKIAIKPQTRN